MALLLLAITACGVSAAAQQAGKATAHIQGERYTLGDKAVQVSWTLKHGHPGALAIHEAWQGHNLQINQPFTLMLQDGTIYDSRTLRADGKPEMLPLVPDAGAARASDRLQGWQFSLPMTDAKGKIRVIWSVILRDGSHYIREELAIKAGNQDLPIKEVVLIEVDVPGARVAGSVSGSPVIAGPFFLAFENPRSISKVLADRATALLDRELPLRAGKAVTYSAVIGTTQPGQFRRDFLSYLERERAHPYRTFLHYNSWYDLGYFNPYDESGALNRINAFGTELHDQRGVILDSFLFDDGWDNHQSLWSFNSGFPDGFAAVRATSAQYGAAPGIWMSPWGGYDGPKQERIDFGRKAGYEIVNGGFALSGPKYFRLFTDVCLRMIRQFGVNQFKFDGTGNANAVFPGSEFDSDFDAAMHLIAGLRHAEPNIFINLTTGTYPSPFWTFYADSIWRGGEDDSETGVGPLREQWITYRDAETYRNVVEAGPLYPLNSLMLHGIIYARYNRKLNTDPENDFRNEVRSYFATGTQCQEMYITPSLLTRQNWDDLAETAKWSRANSDVLRDTHWIGGDPARLEIYGWAAWSPREGILTLRNPSNQPQSTSIDIRQALELPSGATQRYRAKSPWKDDSRQPAIELHAGVPYEFQLVPFEVLTLDLTPEAGETPQIR